MTNTQAILAALGGAAAVFWLTKPKKAAPAPPPRLTSSPQPNPQGNRTVTFVPPIVQNSGWSDGDPIVQVQGIGWL